MTEINLHAGREGEEEEDDVYAYVERRATYEQITSICKNTSLWTRRSAS